MARINSALGRLRGKIGDIVFAQHKGVQVAKLYQPNVTNPRTGQQQANRSKFTALLAQGRLLRPVAVLGFKEYAGRVSWLNRFMSTNSYNDFLIWDEPTGSWLPQYQNLVISEGSLFQSQFNLNELDGADLIIDFPTATFANQSADDELVIIAFVGNQLQSSIRTVIHSAGTVTLTFGNAPTNGQTVTAVGYFITSDGRIVSNSYALQFVVGA